MSRIYAHRGVTRDASENTMPAFEQAIALQADGIEIDVQLTKDGKIVVTHDFSLERLSNGVGNVGDFTYDALSKLDFGKSNPAKGFQRIPLLSEVLELLKPTNLFLNIELKKPNGHYGGMEKLVVDMVGQSGMRERVEYSSFNHHALKVIKELNPQAFTGALYANELYLPWEYIKTFGANAIHPHFGTLLENDIVQQSRQSGVAVNAWTVDSKEDIEKMLSLGVDGIITNSAQLALEIRAEFLSRV